MPDVKERFYDLINKEILLSYAAGIIDGEGCIGMYHNSHNGNYQLRITVEMVDKEALTILGNLFGGKWYIKKAKVPRRERHSWMLFNDEAAIALKQLLPYLTIKKGRAEKALTADWKSFIGGNKMTKEQQSIREEVAKFIKEKNKRGYYE